MEELLRLLDDERHAAAAAARRRRQALDAAGAESATVTGVLLDLHEQGVDVTVRTADAGIHRGPIRLVGADFVVIGTAAGDIWVATTGITTVAGGSRATPGDRERADAITLGEALGRVAAEAPRLQLVLAGGGRVAGVLRAGGADVVALTLDGEGGDAYVSLASERLVLRSG